MKAPNQPAQKRNFFSAKIPLYVALIIIALISFFYMWRMREMKSENEQEVTAAVDKIDNVSLRLVVEDDYKLIKPLAFVEFTKEDPLLLQIKESILAYIDQKKNEGVIVSASAYIRNLSRHQDVRINPEEVYFPGSLMKIPILITYLKEAEKDPSLLDKQLVFSQQYGNLPVQNIKVKTIEIGNAYSVRELLEYMIVYSDNNATALLNSNIDFNKIVKVFAHLQLPLPDLKSAEYGLTLKDYSRFFRVLFNATYLSWEMSEYALELLTRCNYKAGMVKYIDPSVKVAHKFGERNSDGTQQMHEVGIVYLDDKPYLIGIFTKGSDIQKLEEVVASISKIVYDGMKEGKMENEE